MIVAAEIYHADQSDTFTLEDTVNTAQLHLHESGSEVEVQDVVVDKGYYSNELLETFAEETPYRTYIPEPKLPAGRQRVWTDKPDTQRAAVYANRRRSRGERGRRLQRQRSERVERSFAHMCETGGARRTWLCGIDKVRKRYLVAAVAHNLGRLMRALFGIGTPRGLRGAAAKGLGGFHAPQLPQLPRRHAWTIFRHVLSHRITFFTTAEHRTPAAA